MRTGARLAVYSDNSLHRAVESRSLEGVKGSLRQFSETFKSTSQQQSSSFQRGAISWKSPLIEAKRKFLEQINNDGMTALFLAVKLGLLEIATYLIDQDASVEARDKEGNTLLHAAVQFKHPALISLISNANSDLFGTTNKRKFYPIQIALENNDHSTAEEIFVFVKNFTGTALQEISLSQAMIFCNYLSYWQIPRRRDLEEFLTEFLNPRMPVIRRMYPVGLMLSDKKESRRKIWHSMMLAFDNSIENSSLPMHHLCLSKFNLTNNFLYNYLNKIDEEKRKKIHSIDLSHNDLSNVSVHKILKLLPSLRALNLSHNRNLGLRGWMLYSGVQLLAYGLAENNSVEEIDLTNTGLDNADFKALAAAIGKNTKLRLLNISGNPALTEDIKFDFEVITKRKNFSPLQIVMENNPGLSEVVKDKYGLIGPTRRGEASSSAVVKRAMLDEARFGQVVSQPVMPMLYEGDESEQTEKSITSVSTIELIDLIANRVNFLLRKTGVTIRALEQEKLEAKTKGETKSKLKFEAKAKAKSEDAEELENIIGALKVWQQEVTEKLKPNGKVEDILSTLELLIRHFNFICIAAAVLSPDNAYTRKTLSEIKETIESLHDQAEEKYNYDYWPHHDETGHLEVVAGVVRNSIQRAFQYNKYASLTHASGLYERSNITTGEKVFKVALQLVPYVGKAINTLFNFSPIIEGAIQDALSTVKNSKKVQAVGGVTLSSAFFIVLIYREEALRGIPKALHKIYDWALSVLRDALGTTAMENRLRIIAESFSGEEGKQKSARMAAAFVHAYRDIILKLTPREAQVFASVIAKKVHHFLMESTAEKYTEQEMMIWMTGVVMPFEQTVKLRSPQALVQIGPLVRNAGLKCLNTNGQEVRFDLKILVSNPLTGKISWEETNGGMYGYRFAEQELIIALNWLLENNINDPAKTRQLERIRVSEETLFTLKEKGPLVCVPNPFKTDREKLGIAEGEILELKKVVKTQAEEMKEVKECLKDTNAVLEKVQRKLAKYRNSSKQEELQTGEAQGASIELPPDRPQAPAELVGPQPERVREPLVMRSSVILATTSSIVSNAGTLFSVSRLEADSNELRESNSKEKICGKLS
jgi:hypothetical protein